MFKNWQPHIASLCHLALNGEISIDKFYSQWPTELHGSELAELIYEDLEEGIQHFPAKLLSGKPDMASWKASDMYRRIFIACEVLKLDLDEYALKRIRHSLLSDTNLTIGEIALKAKKLSKQGRQ